MGTYTKNLITHEKIPKPEPISEEVLFEGGVMITETDKAGVITYANKKFCSMTGYSKSELIGSPHSINCHPDMPSCAFKDLWTKIKLGQIWEGYVKNIRKDGKYYWVVVWVQPKYDDDKNIIGFIAGRKVPNRDYLPNIEKEYAALKDSEGAGECKTVAA